MAFRPEGRGHPRPRPPSRPASPAPGVVGPALARTPGMSAAEPANWNRARTARVQARDTEGAKMLVMSGDDLFSDLVVSGKGKRRPAFWLPLSLAGHALALAAVVLIPILWPATLPEHPNYIRALLYTPPPPPPQPLPQGSALVEKQQPAQPTTPDPKPDKPTFTAPIETPKEKPDQHEAKLAESEQAGSPTGS